MSGNPRTALVIVDNPDEAATLVELLTGEEFSVLSAESSVQGANLLRRGIQPHLIVIDWMLVRCGADDFLTYVRADRHLSTTPMIVVTGIQDARGDVVADAVFRRPIDQQQLRDTVRALVPVP